VRIGDADHIPHVNSGSYPLREGCRVRPLVDGEPAFRRICQAVEAARSRVWITVAFIEPDVQMPDGRGSFFDVLDRAAERGIDVRVIFWRPTELNPLETGAYFEGSREERRWLAERNSRFLARWDSLPGGDCQHQKSWLIDAGFEGEVGFVGGINLEGASVVSPGHRPRDGGNIHDVYVELQGPAVTDIHHNFVQRWNEASERDSADGVWPPDARLAGLPFPGVASPPAGDARVQLTRTVQARRYSDSTATPGGERFAIDGGESSVFDQYIAAIDRAKRSIYLEDQAIGAPRIVGHLKAALERGVEVAFLVPGNAHPEYRAARKIPATKPFFDLVASLGGFDRFLLAGIASNAGAGIYHDIYVHAKIMLIDDAWATIGSTNVADRSFFGDTELNASFWHRETTRALRCELLQEHLGSDTSDLDDVAALGLMREQARKNQLRRERGEPLEGLMFAIDPAKYGS
jgi:phosphatidylserine/phosphatidylglycerophosphate/cardiolipin synthase-like enzyme